MENAPSMWTKIYRFFEKLSFVAIVATVALLPILFIPSYSYPAQNVRALLFVGTAVLCVFTLIFRFILERKISIQKSPATWVFVVLALFAVVSSLLSSSFGSSFVGDGAEIGTSSYLLAFAAILLAMPAFFAEKKRVFYFYFAFLFSFVVLAVFHGIRLIAGPNFLSFGILTMANATLAGNWNDVAILAGAAALFSIIGLEIKAFGGFLRGLLYAVFPLSLILLAVVNFSIGWTILTLLSLFLSIYFFAVPKDGTGRSVPLFAGILLVVSVTFVLAGGLIGTKISSFFNISQVEAHPLWSTTLSVATPVLKTNPFFGAGPNRFSYVWQLLKPVGVNNSPFWATAFVFGVGIVPTALITLGVVGSLLYLIFFLLYLWKGIGAIKNMGTKSEISQFAVLSSFCISLFFWVVSIMYVPGIVAYSLTALWTGLFFAVLQSEGMVAPAVLSFENSRIIRGVFAAVLGMLMVATVWFGAIYASKAVAAAYLQKAQYSAAVDGDPAAAAAYLQKALNYSKTPLLYRSLVSADLGKLNKIIASASNTQPTDALKAQFNAELADTLNAAKQAISGDPVDFRNWVSVGSIYETLLPVGTKNAYENANGAYARAQALSPLNPEMYLNLARLEFEHASSTAAKAYISKALALKGDYVAGIFLLSQIQVAEKDISGAIKSLTAAANINPNDQTVLYQLGVLTYSTGDYKTSAAALEAAVRVNPSFANARYFLALTYVKLDRRPEALSQLQEIQKLNPDSAEIKSAIANLQGTISSGVSDGKTATTTPKIVPKKK